jgi:glycosyltransferase involved in cell wall biosynthesis
VGFEKWGVVSPKDDTGFGRMAEDLRSVLGVGRQWVVPSDRMSTKPLSGADEIFLDPALPETELERLFQGFEGIFFFERHTWHPLMLPVAKKMGLKTVCVVMWEWFVGSNKTWKWCDSFVCTSELALRTVRKAGFENVFYLPWTLDIRRFPKRIITGPARVFVHNTGLVDFDDRKGIRDTIEAFKKVKRKDIRLMVRSQNKTDLPVLDERIEVFTGNLPNPSDLTAQGDVAVQPSKMEGMGLMILEPLVSGMPVLTTNAPPMNEWVRRPEMLVKPRWFSRKAFASQWVSHTRLRLPNVRDLARKIQWCCENDLSEISRANRQWAEEVYAPERLKEAWTIIR